MKITKNLLSIPPFISTSWDNIASLQAEPEHFQLTISLKNGTDVVIPHLDPQLIEEVFEAHSRYANPTPEKPPFPNTPFSFSIPLKPDSATDLVTPSMQHDPEQQNALPLPPEVLDKIVDIARAFGLEDTSALLPPEPNCNCMYCQLARALLLKGDPAETEEEVTEADLHFRDWEVVQTDEKLYCVTNPIEVNEHYTVFLGDPLGCTCGQKNCEHIHAVLCSE